MSDLLKDLQKYFDETPREQIMKDWGATAKWDSVGVPVAEFIGWQKAGKEIPAISKQTVKHEFKVLTKEEVIKDRSNAYQFIDFDNPPHKEGNKNSEAC